MDLRRRLARAILPAAALITILSIAIPAPAAATEPVVDPVTTTLPANEPTTTTDPAPASTVPADPAAAVEPAVPVAAPKSTTTRAVHHRRKKSAAARLIAVARRQLGDCYVYALQASALDCSGLAIYALEHSHNRRVVHGGLDRRARSSRATAAATGQPPPWPRRRPRRVGRGHHIGVYLGHGGEISALTRRGVRHHRSAR